MALPVNFQTLAGGNELLSLLDTQFAAAVSLGAIPCACSGTNTLTLTPLANTPTIAGYPDLQPSFVFVAAQTSTSSVSANVNLVGSRNVYKWNGSQAVGNGDIIAGNVYRLTPLAALNGGLGGFVCDTIGVANNTASLQFIIDGGGVQITTGVKGFIHVPWSANVVFWNVIGDQSGSIVVDVLRANAAVPSVSMIGGGGNKPTLSAVQLNGAAPSGWTSTAIVAADFLGFQVISATTVTKVTVELVVSKI